MKEPVLTALLTPGLMAETVPHRDTGATRIGPNEGAGYNLVLICRSCGHKWSIQPGPDGYFFPGFWRCPRRCDG